MGMTSSTGLPFLYGGGGEPYRYCRRLPEDLHVHVAGRIELTWTHRARDLLGGAVVKISFATKDDKIGRERWAVVHPQVEALVLAAIAKARKAERTNGAPLPVAALGPKDIRILAAQARHDVLAADDASWDPDYASPLGGVIEAVRARSRFRSSDATVDELAAAARARVATARLRNKDLISSDREIREGPVEVPPHVREEVFRAGASAKQGDRLSPEATALLLGQTPTAAVIPSDVEALLRENGVTLPLGHPDRKALVRALLRAEVRASLDVEARLAGAPIETPERPPRLAHAPPAQVGPKLSDMRARWIALYDRGTKLVDDNELYVGRFVDMFGDLPVAAVTRKMVREFRDALETCPRNMPDAVRAMRFQDQLAWGARHPDVPKLSRQTINSKGIGSISACMRAAIKDEHIEVNPCADQDLPLRKKDKLRRVAYDLADLVKIFATTIYGPERKRWDGGGGEAAFWIPLVALFTGARLEEIGQLHCVDVREEDGVVFFDIVDLSDDEDAHAKSLKSENARRTVPVHGRLVEAGFLDYVAAMRAEGSKTLFPDLKAFRGRATHNWSKWWARHADRSVTTSPHKVFHSTRHKFIDRMRELEVDRTVLKALVGHSKGDVTDQYGGVSLSARRKAIAKLDYPGLDLSHVRWKPPVP